MAVFVLNTSVINGYDQVLIHKVKFLLIILMMS